MSLSSHLFVAAADSQHHRDGRAGDVAQLGDHHGDEVGGGHVVHQVQELQVLDGFPVLQEVSLPSPNRNKVVGVA